MHFIALIDRWGFITRSLINATDMYRRVELQWSDKIALLCFRDENTKARCDTVSHRSKSFRKNIGSGVHLIEIGNTKNAQEGNLAFEDENYRWGAEIIDDSLVQSALFLSQVSFSGRLVWSYFVISKRFSQAPHRVSRVGWDNFNEKILMYSIFRLVDFIGLQERYFPHAAFKINCTWWS